MTYAPPDDGAKAEVVPVEEGAIAETAPTVEEVRLEKEEANVLLKVMEEEKEEEEEEEREAEVTFIFLRIAKRNASSSPNSVFAQAHSLLTSLESLPEIPLASRKLVTD
ncbi:unnamed protein product [Dibothriocephalus latus]|uniref:Uncharacterized protein n=1 Tax=Dibothriocephalus latus TaxID=60516 RepID=A0A3P7NUD2_DIBLA|nr:unnamed protein product [Dibothriocephalus latus]